MVDPQIEKLLVVQDRDTKVRKIEQDLARIPKERAELESRIEAERGQIEAAGEALKAKEVERNELDAEVQTKEAAVKRFRNQQLEVKKNDEYRALTQEIEQAQSAISDLEEREIGLMLEIDSARENYESEKARIEERIARERERIAELDERAANLESAAESARAELEKARGDADPEYLRQYDRVKQIAKRPPFVVPIEDHKCGGCHLRVSNEVSKGAMASGEPHFCDQCARMVYA